MANASVLSVAKGFVKAYDQYLAAQRKYNRFVNEELPKLTASKPTKSEYTKIAALLAGRAGNSGSWDLRDWIATWKVEFAKTIKYKGFEIKVYEDENLHRDEYVAFRNGVREWRMTELDKLKATIDERLDAEKKMPKIMAKLGLDKLFYETYECKRSTVFDRTRHSFAEEMVCQLYKFWKLNPNVKDWKIWIEHNACSHTDSELSHECYRECEYSYAKGDYVTIQAGGLLCWGAMRG